MQQVRVEEMLAAGDLPDCAAKGWTPGGASPEVVFAYLFEDGSRYAWQWDCPQLVRLDEKLWCAPPSQGDVVSCVRQSTILAEPEVMQSKKDTLQLLRSRFAHPPAPLIDTDVLQPADVTAGTGLSQEDARFLLRSRHAWLVRRGRALLGGTAGASGWVAMQLGTFLGAGLDYPALGAGAAIIGGPTLAAFALDRVRNRPARVRAAQAAQADLEVVEIIGGHRRILHLRTRDGERYSCTLESDLRAELPNGTRLWATRLEDPAGYLVGTSPLEGKPVVLRVRSVAPQRPGRSRVQDRLPGD
ncbi:hypothetical protein [Gephyromycinifex aptenodytis]|uniref:hypothetical protein n=1 Tax=Gephyromycinifex aptenodytis TaxID=2716227 RepID=UPI001444B689|nr:hypothetical protein [Gephyromycinifex aptenodytis]